MLNIDANSLAQLTAHALAEYPNECCGVLLGTRIGANRRVSRIEQCRNVHPSPATRYTIDPAELISVQRNARELHCEIVGFYHSHPDHAPNFSQTDFDEANWAGCTYIIVSVNDHLVTATRAYHLIIEGQDKSFVEEPLSTS